jgi:hypothetical protein
VGGGLVYGGADYHPECANYWVNWAEMGHATGAMGWVGHVGCFLTNFAVKVKVLRPFSTGQETKQYFLIHPPIVKFHLLIFKMATNHFSFACNLHNIAYRKHISDGRVQPYHQAVRLALHLLSLGPHHH